MDPLLSHFCLLLMGRHPPPSHLWMVHTHTQTHVKKYFSKSVIIINKAISVNI